MNSDGSRQADSSTNDSVSAQSFLHYKLQILVCLRGGSMYLSILEVEQILIRFISWHWMDLFVETDLYRLYVHSLLICVSGLVIKRHVLCWPRDHGCLNICWTSTGSVTTVLYVSVECVPLVH